MNNSNFKFLLESPLWQVALSLAVGVLYSYFLYKNKYSWQPLVNKILAVARFLLVSILCLLLLNILFQTTKNSTRPKVIGILIDNSLSINKIGKNNLASLQEAIKDMVDKLGTADNEVYVASLDKAQIKNIDSIKYNYPKTNLAKLINTFKSNHDGENISDLIVISDGINNDGLSASGYQYPFSIHTVGIGDTTVQKDIFIKSIIGNDLAYKGNNFTLQAEVMAVGYNNQPVQVSLTQGDKVLQTKSITLKGGNEPNLVEFIGSSNTLGLNKFQIKVSTSSGEFSTSNNSRTRYIEIVDGRQKILLLAPAPHPDIKALKYIIDNNENFEVDVLIANQLKPLDIKQKKYDLAILHGLPDEQGALNTELKYILDQNIPRFTIVTNQTSLANINNNNPSLKINAPSAVIDKVTAQINDNFKTIQFDLISQKILDRLPPLTVPYGDIKTNLEVILQQKVGSVTNNKPLLLLNNGTPKEAYLLGEGLWAWRMEEYNLTEKYEGIDELFSKIIQYLSAKNDARKLRVNPKSKEVLLGDAVELETEIFNTILQNIYNEKVSLNIKSDKGFNKNYEYKLPEGATSYAITGLPEGIYKYTASSLVNGKTETTSGEFFIQNSDIERENTQANFDELRLIATNSGGNFYNISQLGKLQKDIQNSPKPQKIYTEEQSKELIEWPWLLAILLVLAALEWATRKFLGSY